MIRLNNIVKIYNEGKENEFKALKGVDFAVEEGEFVAITGPSGCGKSTLMHIIGLLDKPTSGIVVVGGKHIYYNNDNLLSQIRSETVGFVFQQFNLINKLTVLENVLLPTIYKRGASAAEYKKRAEYLLTRFGLAEKMHSYPNKISGGQQQRVAIARALIMEPRIILADEPTGNLDTQTGNEIMRLLKELNKEGTTIVVVTHEADVAAQAKRVVAMRDGMIMAKNAPPSPKTPKIHGAT